MWTTTKLFLFYIGIELCSTASVERMFMSRTSSSDLAPEATGYIYRSDNSGPASYIKLGPDDVNKHLGSIQSPFIADYSKPIPTIHDHLPSKIEYENYLRKLIEQNSSQKDSDEKESDENEDSDENENSDEDEDDDSDEASDEIEDDDEEYASDSDSNEESSKGSHDVKGYKVYETAEKAQKGNHENSGEKSNYEENGGAKSGHFESVNNYDKKHAAAEADKGERFSEKKGHNRGSKTTGFHNVYHKDEFKKKNEFYDEADRNGRFNKHANHEAKSHSNEGGYVNGGKSDAAFNQADYGNKHYSDKGSNQESDQGYEAKNGQEAFYNNDQRYNANSNSDKFVQKHY